MQLTRRRFLTLSACAAGMAALPCSALTSTPQTTWKGAALGADAQITLVHPNRTFAKQTLALCVSELERLEQLFSLYRSDSMLCQLNQEGKIIRPPEAFVALLQDAITYGHKTDGLFDISIQPLWQLYHQHFKQPNAAPEGPDTNAIAQILELVNYQHIDVSTKHIKLRKGMALTFNGIAQGAITDRIAALLTQHGFENALINLGEYAALGQRSHSQPWQCGIANPKQPWNIYKTRELPRGKSMATSGAYGTQWSTKAHHLLSPKTGRPAQTNHASVSIIADSATQADALATYCALLSMNQAQTVLAENYPHIQADFFPISDTKSMLY